MTRERGVARAALDRRLAAWHDLGSSAARPRGGWVRAIRDALGMTAADLADRMGVDQSTVTRLEQSERQRTVQLDTLERAADALDCELLYALVPRNPLEETVRAQARRRALEEMRRVNHTMGLEAQSAEDDSAETRVRALAEELASRRDLWRSPDGTRNRA